MLLSLHAGGCSSISATLVLREIWASWFQPCCPFCGVIYSRYFHSSQNTTIISQTVVPASVEMDVVGHCVEMISTEHPIYNTVSPTLQACDAIWIWKPILPALLISLCNYGALGNSPPPWTSFSWFLIFSNQRAPLSSAGTCYNPWVPIFAEAKDIHA